MARVTLCKVREPVDEGSIYDAVKRVLDLLGGVERFIKPGERVLINPNFVSPRRPPVTTDPRTVRAVALLVKEVGAEPIIGEGSSAMTHWWREGMTTMRVMEELGIDKVAEEVGAELYSFDAENKFFSKMAEIPNATLTKRLELAEIGFEVDKIVPVPILKTSMEGGGITGCIKGFHAFVDAFTDRLRFHRSDLWYKLVDTVKAFREKIGFCVMDAVTAMEGDGPIHGMPVDMNLIIAGDDPVATDSIAARVIGYKAPHLEIGPIGIAHSEGVGVGDPDQIEVTGERLEDVSKNFIKATCEVVEPWFPNTVLMDGASDRTCKAWIKFTLYMLRGAGFFERFEKTGEKLFFFVGQDPPLPSDLEEIRRLAEEGLVIVFGACAIHSLKNHYWPMVQGDLKDRVILMPGCPPFAVQQQANVIAERLAIELEEEEAFKYVPT